MMKQHKIFLSGVVIAIMVFIIIGCGLFDRDSGNTPTGPATINQTVNFYTGGALVSEVGVYIPEDKNGFMVNIPDTGDYVVEYTTTAGGTFYVVLRVKTGGATAHIGLRPGDVINDANLYKTEIPSELQVLQENNHAAVYFLPPSGSIILTNSITIEIKGVTTKLEVFTLWRILIQQGKYPRPIANGVNVAIQITQSGTAIITY